MKAKGRKINAIVLLDKPLVDSSNAALQRVKRLFNAAKAGHTGSLDPLATGMLPICFGEATKIAALLLGSRKAYVAEAQLGVTTASGDAEGEVTSRRPVPKLQPQAVEAAMAGFRGRISQMPPVYSALKQDGERLYKRARRGEDVKVEPREVDIIRFELLALDGDRVRVSVECGSGTYIRSLLSDLGDALGCGAHVSALRRSWVEPFTDQPMHSLPELEALAGNDNCQALDGCLLPLEAGLMHLPEVHLGAADSVSMSHGHAVDMAADGLSRVYAEDGRLLALAEPDERGRLAVRRGFNLPASKL